MASNLERKRGSLKHRLTNLGKYIDNLAENKPGIAEIEEKLRSYQSILESFQEIQGMLEEKCTDEQIDEHYNYQDDFENSYDKYIGILKQYLRDNGAPASVNQVNNINNNVQNSWNNISLPKIKIDTFKGEYEHWLEFKSTFLSVVHTSNISNIQKFQILRQSVDGYAKRIVDQVEFVGDYYDTAWNALCERFNNKKILINKHIKGILKLEPLVKESSKQLRDLLDLVSENISAIEGMKISKGFM
ncbi:hypothetical protein JTB14_025671 [Gonioctena quinquepunctata]|nr:hypothetical protein JTB14_025671 [Gonioctena quinquepunctata]